MIIVTIMITTYTQTRSIGNGGAIYVHLKLPSVYNKIGLVNISGCDFKANHSPSKGGVIFISPAISFNLEKSKFISIDRPGEHAKVYHINYLELLLYLFEL